uniref:Peptidase C1A papain C-terminal domain-containing protein n=1 Tax=Alexandrium catenella TaxID=2925 RepID=A0A7S1MCX3_ALECA
MRSFLSQKLALAVFVAHQILTALASYHATRAGVGGSAFQAATGRSEAYDAFRRLHGREGAHDPVDYETRLRRFEENAAEVSRLNSRSGASWVAVVNRFADYTPGERRALLGYRGPSSRRVDTAPAPSSFLEARERHITVADSMDWRSRVTDYVHDQGACGSCWAVAAVGALEMHAELSGKKPVNPLSFEQVVDCVENPKHCGGSGGCDGATAELAFDYVAKYGVMEASAYTGGYMGTGANSFKCPSSAIQSARPAVRTGGFKRLPVNKVAPLLEVVSSTGPAVVSVDATQWGLYGMGVFNQCGRNATVNHAVLLVGYGHSAKHKMDYWLIRNSWGAKWGENGYIRLQRHEKDAGEAGYCGMDPDSKQGVGCDGDPKEIPVCGMCGVLSDTSYPTDVTALHGEEA